MVVFLLFFRLGSPLQTAFLQAVPSDYTKTSAENKALQKGFPVLL